MVKATIAGVSHASLLEGYIGWLKKQMPQGFGPVFSLSVVGEDFARRLPNKPRVFQHATRLCGVESPIEARKILDHIPDRNALRFSSGHLVSDLQEDLLGGLQLLTNKEKPT